MSGSKVESTHSLWKDEVGGGVSIRSQTERTRARTSCGVTKWEGSASHCRLKGREHAQSAEGRSGRWGQHLIAGSKDETTHNLWKNEVGGGVSMQSQAQRTRARTSCGRTKWEVVSASDRRLKG